MRLELVLQQQNAWYSSLIVVSRKWVTKETFEVLIEKKEKEKFHKRNIF